MAEWFGFDDAICPHEIGLDGPHEKFFPCFAGMPQGWTWALYFCQSAIQHCGERALGPGRALVHGRPAPDLLAGPVCSTYVDNIMCLTQPGQGAQVYAQVRKEATAVGLDLHEETSGYCLIENVSMVISKKDGKLRYAEIGLGVATRRQRSSPP